MAKKYPIDEIQDHIEHVKELETKIDRLKDRINDLEFDLEVTENDTTQNQLDECEEDYEDARDTAEKLSKLLTDVLNFLNKIEVLPVEYHKDIKALIKEINYAL